VCLSVSVEGHLAETARAVVLQRQDVPSPLLALRQLRTGVRTRTKAVAGDTSTVGRAVA
jgi:hypothetical protein